MTAPALAGTRLQIDRAPGDVLHLRLAGHWTLAAGVPALDGLLRELESGPPPSRITFDSTGVEGWDSALVAFAHRLHDLVAAPGVEVDESGLPDGARQLLDLARAVPRVETARGAEDDALTARVGTIALHAWDTTVDAVGFLGETVIALGSMLRGRARFRGADLMHAVEASGVGALGIVGLISFLIGAVLAFVGAVQLVQFGAGIYVANLVAIGVTRELGALMTGIVMCGRTGASFAAVLGTMTVNEEIDALRTMGLKPAEFLVAPRVLATSLMLPALVAYADVLGILGGMLVGVTLLRLGPTEFLEQTRANLAFRQVAIGLVKSVAFGAVVALTGCYYGIRCGRSAAAVGEATTKAVVLGIVFVVVVDAVFTVLLYALGL
jgi:phospholipid/cholesterol/gamma-HCH transport system permease protein